MESHSTVFLRSFCVNLASKPLRWLDYFVSRCLMFSALFPLSVFIYIALNSDKSLAAQNIQDPTHIGATVSTGNNAHIAARIETLEKSLNMLQKYTYNLSTEANTVKGGESTHSAEVANVDEINEHLKSIHNDMEKLQQDIARINERITQISSDFEQRISNIEQPIKEQKEAQNMVRDMESELEEVYSPKNQENPTVRLDDPSEIPANSVEDEFRIAYGYLKSKNYTKAQEAFEAFIKKYPRSTIVGAARYWLGEIYAVHRSYDQAAVEYLKGYQSNPTGNRAADNLLRLGEMLIKLDKRQEACSTLTKMSKEFPKLQPSLKRQVDKVMNEISCVK